MSNIVVVGGGFAGMWAALTAARELHLAGSTAKVSLISRDEYLTVRPRLYEVFTTDFRAPLGQALDPLDIDLVIADVRRIDTKGRVVHLTTSDGAESELSFERLVLATGSQQRALPVPGASEHTFDIDTFAGAEKLDEHLHTLLSAPGQQPPSIAIVGGGFTGIELATEMRAHIRAHSDDETAKQARVILVERSAAIGPELGEKPRPYIEDALRDADVDCRLNCTVERIDADSVLLSDGTEIETRTVVSTAGLQAEPLAASLGEPCDEMGRVRVDEYLSVPGIPFVFVAGDVAHALADPEHPALMSCQHAVPMGKYAGFNVAHDLIDKPKRAYSQPNYVTCLDLGAYGSLFTTGWERNPEQHGAEVKPLKQTINTQWIYPPSGNRDDILKAADLDAPWPPET